MNIVYITPGAGGMYCGNCFRDNALVACLRRMGHSALMVPLYLPMTLDEADQSAGTPIFFSGINVYLEQKIPLFRNSPAWLHRLLASPGLLKWAAGRAAKTRAEEVGDLTLSMLRGREGNQARELDELIGWLKQRQAPDVICLSNALLVGLVRQIKKELRVPVVCMLQGEDTFLDTLPAAQREACWNKLAERAREVDLFIAPSRYFGKRMTERLGLPEDRVRIVYNGISLDGYTSAGAPARPVLGYFARMCREKGLDLLVESYIQLRRRGRVPGLKLKIGGGCGPGEQAFVHSIHDRLKSEGLLDDVTFHRNVSRDEKLDFYRSLSVFSVPALYGEAFGLYLIEALAAGVPVVKPRHAAFPELIEATGGGLLCEPTAAALSEGIEELLLNPERARQLGEAGRQAVTQNFTVERMAANTIDALQKVTATGAVASAG